MVANIKQRREINNSTRLACSARDFDRISRSIRGLDIDVVKDVQDHLRSGGVQHALSGRGTTVVNLLKQCQLISRNVPGSKAAMSRARADIRGYIGEFGVFHIFLTLNPSPTHSPVFQVFYGDARVNLNVNVPTMPSADERAKRVADDPVAASDYFHFHVAAIFQYLFGWDQKSRRSLPDGGIFGALEAFYMVKEHTMRGQLHGHALIWLKHALNPSDERPPDPKDPRFAEVTAEDHHLLGEEVQRHKCTTTCLKGGRSSCRFLFPHEIVKTSFYDAETNSVFLRVWDAFLNWHNKWLLLAARHNVDVKWVQSGLSGLAAVSYITAYTTKSEETPANQVSMIQTVLERMASLGQDSTILKDLLCRCVMQFGRERQVHAQQAATYVRDLGDTCVSHNTIPMFSGRLMLIVRRLYGPDRQSPPTPEAGTSVSAPASQLTSDTSAVGADAPFTCTASLSSQGQTEQVFQTSPDATPVTAVSDVITNAVVGEGEDTDDDDQMEELLPLRGNGQAHQVDDYLHRGPSLDHLNFYEFVRYCTLVDLPRKSTKDRHPLRDSHPNSKTSCHRYTPLNPNGVPYPLFSKMPRSDGTTTHGDAYCAAMLAHFRPFGVAVPLKSPSMTYEASFKDTNFSPEALRVMNNWNALTECDDARDAEELKRRKRQACRDYEHDEAAKTIIQKDQAGVDDPNADVNIEALIHRRKGHSAATLSLMATLATSHWFTQSKHSPIRHPSLEPVRGPHCPPFILSQRKTWQHELSELDARSKANAAVPRATTGILASALSFDDQVSTAPDTTDAGTIEQHPIRAHQTIRYKWRDPPPHVIINTLIDERNLTQSQALAFKIAARHFFTDLAGTAFR
ncbi:hypothetical protein OC835_005872 [Tilletia horrida]|nr:hypothetical protein OC835_005872 [Tilletia horrida]